MSILYLNGDFLEAKQAKIPVMDRSFLFGEGLFETFRSYSGKLPFLKENVARLEWSSTYLNLDFPTETNFEKICLELLKRNHLENARFKIVLSSIDDDHNAATTQVVILCSELKDTEPPALYRLKSINTFVNDPLPLAAMKTTNYLIKVLAKKDALEAGFDDGILLNSRGKVTETCSANIFWVNAANKLCTIAPDQGLLSGITRKLLMKLLDENKITVNETMATTDELSYSREIFVTNSIIGVKPVVAIDQRQISGGEIGSITAMIQDLWKKKINELIK